MKLEWDYTELADAYLRRPDYADEAIDSILAVSGVREGGYLCDIGAGTGNLTVKLAQKGLRIVAVEPNDAMRNHGIARTRDRRNVFWVKGAAEETGLHRSSFDVVTFGSSFNVVNQDLALREADRILKPQGCFVCLWNHRDLSDPIQSGIEEIIHATLGGYSYGARRQDQTDLLLRSGYFREVRVIEGRVVHKELVSDQIEAWRSHATLKKHAGEQFGVVIERIERFLRGKNRDAIEIPYTTRAWLAVKHS
jgi:ubiquinone/menaquinone biosynthesis C-methylase UbiE